MKQDKKDRNAGFTLIESVIAILIVAFAAVSLAQAYAYSQIFILKSGLRRQALQTLQNEMEGVRNTNWASNNPIKSIPSRMAPFEYGERLFQAMLDAKIDNGTESGGLKYQDIRLTLAFENAGEEDTVALSARLYHQ